MGQKCKTQGARSGTQLERSRPPLLANAADDEGDGEERKGACEEFRPCIHTVKEKKTRQDQEREDLRPSGCARSQRNEQTPDTADPEALQQELVLPYCRQQLG